MGSEMCIRDSLTSDPEICAEVIKVSSSIEVFKYLVSSDNLELRHRGLYILANMIESSQEIAAKLIEDELFELLMALKLTNKNSQGVQKELDRCFQGAEKWKLIQENPEKDDK